jgi:hypothetical protein
LLRRVQQNVFSILAHLLTRDHPLCASAALIHFVAFRAEKERMPPKVPVVKHNEAAAHDGRCRCVAIGPASGLVLASGGDDCAVNVWRLGRPANILVSRFSS